MDPDTREFLKRNGMVWDHILYGDYKYSDLVKIVGRERILAVVDDLPEQITRARKLGLPAIMRRGPHNEWWLRGEDAPGDLMVVNSCKEMQDVIGSLRKERNGSRRSR